MRLVYALMAVVVFGIVTSAAEQPSDEARQQLRDLVDVGAGRNAPLKPVTPDAQSPVAAGRYFVLIPQLSPDLANQAATVAEDRLDTFTVFEGSETPAPVIAQQLEQQQPWIRAFMDAALLERGDLRLRGSFRDRAFAKGDPREGMYSGLRRANRVLRADAVRLWAKGEHAAALERLSACMGVVAHLNQERFNEVRGLMAQYEVGKVTTLVVGMKASLGGAALPDCGALRRLVEGLDRDDPTRIRATWREGVAARLEFAANSCKGAEVSDRLILELAELRAMTASMKGFFEAALSGKPGEQVLDRRKLLEEVTKELGSLSAESVRASLVAARRCFAEVDAGWEKGEVSLDDGDDADLVIEYALGVPAPMQRKWKEGREELATLRSALGIKEGAVVPEGR